MTILDCILAALTSIRVNVLRSALTALGIIIGVGAVITMVAIGAGAEARVQELISSLGSNLLMVQPGSTTSSGAHLGRGSRPTITEADANAIQDEVASVLSAAPVVRGSGQIVIGNLNWSSGITGVTPDYLDVRNWTISAGRGFTADEANGGAKVALLGATVVENLFAGQDPIDQVVRIQRVPFRVVGVLGAKGESSFGHDQDDTVFVPISTAKTRVLGGRQLRGDLVSTIYVKVRSPALLAQAERDVGALLRQRHRLGDGRADDFYIRNLAEIMSARAESSQVMTVLLAAIASVSLLVGGIGIMNIMLVSVTERTREIGLRMAVGATRRDILLQFLIEALTLSLIGGGIGVVLGIAGSVVVARLAEWPMLLEPQAMVVAFGFAALVGVFFGFYPARKAAGLNPIEALHYE